MFVTGGAGNHLGEEADKTAMEDLKIPSFGEKLAVEERVKTQATGERKCGQGGWSRGVNPVHCGRVPTSGASEAGQENP